MEILHPTTNKPKNVLWLNVWDLAQKDRHKQALERTFVHHNICLDREIQIGQCFAVLHQMEVPFRFISFELFRRFKQSCRLIENKNRILGHVIK
ncbi:hypothetical protein D3C78_1841350 [compost metagenome]